MLSNRPYYFFVVTMACLFVGSVRAENVRDAAEAQAIERAETLFGEFEREIQQVDWQRESVAIDDALQKVWRRNGWSDESDRFALQLAREISTIPPWQVMDRINLVSERATERYGLSQPNAARIKGKVLRELGTLMARHYDVVVSQTREMLETRFAEKPFTPEMVARMVKEGQPMMNDFEKAVEGFRGELEQMVPGEKQDVLRADFRSFEKRQRHVVELTARWERGEWHPSDWGLDGDPIQQKAATNGVPAPAKDARTSRAGAMGKPGDAAPLPKWQPVDPLTWFAYVVEFARKFRLDAGQFTAARSIHDELRTRALDYLKSRKEELSVVLPAKRAEHPGYQPVLDVFEELRNRLDAIPTTSQRADAAKVVDK